MDYPVGNTYLEVDLGVIKENLIQIKKHIGQGHDVMPVLKANAAGMGIKKLGLFLTEECHTNIIAIAQVCEALKLREVGIKSELLVMGGVPYNNIATAVELNVHMPVYNMEFATLVNNEGKAQHKRVKLHIKIETGMNRIGVKPGKDLSLLIKYLKNLDYIDIIGVYTHFVESETRDKQFTYYQNELFMNALSQIREQGINPRYIHACNSAAAVWFKEAYYTHVRPGRLLYGFDPNMNKDYGLNLQSPVTWYAFVTNIKEIDAGETLGYRRYFKANNHMKIATLSFGYGDGYNRNLIFHNGYVIINGERAPLIDMCMDQSFADITTITNVSANERAILLGRDGEQEIGIHNFSNMLGQSYMNSMSTIGERVSRLYRE